VYGGAECIAHKTLGRVSFFGGDSDACYIGLKEPVSITLLTYDLQVTSTRRLFSYSRLNTASPTLSSPGCYCGP